MTESIGSPCKSLIARRASQKNSASLADKLNGSHHTLCTETSSATRSLNSDDGSPIKKRMVVMTRKSSSRQCADVVDDSDRSFSANHDSFNEGKWWDDDLDESETINSLGDQEDENDHECTNSHSGTNEEHPLEESDDQLIRRPSLDDYLGSTKKTRSHSKASRKSKKDEPEKEEPKKKDSHKESENRKKKRVIRCSIHDLQASGLDNIKDPEELAEAIKRFNEGKKIGKVPKPSKSSSEGHSKSEEGKHGHHHRSKSSTSKSNRSERARSSTRRTSSAHHSRGRSTGSRSVGRTVTKAAQDETQINDEADECAEPRRRSSASKGTCTILSRRGRSHSRKSKHDDDQGSKEFSEDDA